MQNLREYGSDMLDEEAATGCTVLIAEEGMAAAVDIREEDRRPERALLSRWLPQR